MPLRILIVEDEPLYRDSLIDILNLEGFAAAGVGSIASYRAWRQSHSCDVLIIDRNLPDGDGLDVIKAHRQTESGPVIVITCKGLSEDRIQGMNADADYYLVKPIVTDELVALLNRLFRKIDQTLTQGDAWMLNPVNWRLKNVGGAEVLLTRNELTFMNCFVEKPGLAINRNEIIQALGEDPHGYDLRRLETLIRRLRLKVKAAGAEELPLVTVYSKGYAFNGQLSRVD